MSRYDEAVAHLEVVRKRQERELRDRFAMATVNNCLEQCSTVYEAAREAYRIADAMMEARKPHG